MRLVTLFTTLTAAVLLSTLTAQAGGKQPTQYPGDWTPGKGGKIIGDWKPGGKGGDVTQGDAVFGRPSRVNPRTDFRPWSNGGNVTEGDLDLWSNGGDVTEGDMDLRTSGPDASGYIEGDQLWLKLPRSNNRQARNNRQIRQQEERYRDDEDEHYGLNDFPPRPARMN